MSNKKTELLGENFSTASNKLKKAIMFSLIQRLGLDTCHRCELKIDTVDTLSVEHIEAWQTAEDPISAFYDLENITFSHLVCNVSAAYRTKRYATSKMQRDSAWARYYLKNKEALLKRKRDRYHRNKNTRV